MQDKKAKSSILSEDCAFFIPSQPQLRLVGSSKRWNLWSGQYLDPDDFTLGDLLLMQDHNGGYWWAHFENLLKRNSEMRLHPCFLSHRQADRIAKKRILFIDESDLRLSDFSLLSKADKPTVFDKLLEKPDLVARHLASAREVSVFRKDSDGKKILDEIKTADYSRAKADLRRNPTDTRNMLRFCKRQGSSGEGPSKLESRVCHGYVKPGYGQSSSTEPSLEDADSFTSEKADAEEPPCAVRKHRKRSITYRIMKLAHLSPTKLEAEQYRYDLKRARREKRPEGYLPPRRVLPWNTLAQRVSSLRRSRERKQQQPASEHSETQRAARSVRGGRQCFSSSDEPPPALSSRSGHCKPSLSPVLTDETDVSPLRLPATVSGAARAAEWVERLEAFPPAGVIHGAHSKGHEPSLKHDSLGDGITDGTQTANPRAAAGVGRENVERPWSGRGGWKWIFDEGME